MRCEAPGCRADACRDVTVRGEFRGVHMDKVLHLCEDHGVSLLSTAFFAQQPLMVDPYRAVLKLRRKGALT